MGCGPSGMSYKNGGIRLIATKLTFTKDQLDNLNSHFRKIAAEARSEIDTLDVDSSVESAVEVLVQKLIAAVGTLDRRFSSMFLVSLNERRRVKKFNFEYLLRIDALSTPAVNLNAETTVSVEEEPAMPGFARLRMRATALESWAEFLGAGGRLRRDLVKAKLASLLATVIKQGTTTIENDSTCLAPGQVVDAEVLDKILKQPDHCRVYYGPAFSNGHLPEPKDHRIALVEDSGGLLLKIGLEGFKTNDVQIRLLIGVGISSWSSVADYPRRVPLHHCDALLHYTAAQSGMYAVAIGPYPGARCEDRTTLWQLRAPAAETVMNQHYCDSSVVTLTDFVLMEILDQLREGQLPDLPTKQKSRLRVTSRHILRTIHRWSLERTGPDPLRSWAPNTLSRQILLALDEVVTSLKCQNLRCYFYPRCNVMLQSARGGVLHHEDSYMSDARLVESYLLSLHRQCAVMKPSSPLPMDVMEAELIGHWRRVMSSLPRGTMSSDYGYSHRQIDYLSLILKEVLHVKDVTLQDHVGNCSYLSLSMVTHTTEPIENLVYLLRLALRQARDQIDAATGCNLRKHDHCKVAWKKSRCNMNTPFDRSVELLIDVVRRDRETAYIDLESHIIMARSLLRWLYFGMDHDRKVLEPILRPYLNNLFNASHENAWHMESWTKRREVYASEMRSLSMFCKLVTMQEMSPANGIVEALSKGWNWAENVARMIERSNNSLRLLFMTSRGVFRYNLTFANNKGLSAYSTWSKARNIGNAVRRNRSISRAAMIVDNLPSLNSESTADVSKGIAGHAELRDVSPLTYIVSMSRRRGWQRGPGGLIPALISLNKFRILQEVAALLPQNERIALLNMVQQASRDSSRRLRRASCPDSSIAGSPRQTYTPRSESNLLDSPPGDSPVTCRGFVAVRQEQLEREMQTMRNTLSRCLRSRQPLPAWDSISHASWTSSVSSIGRRRVRKHRSSIWVPFKGTSPMWDRISIDNSFTNSRSEEMISKEESPKWGMSCNGCPCDDFYSKEEDRLRSWDVLEASLSEKLSKYNHARSDSHDINRDVSIDYLISSNDKKAS